MLRANYSEGYKSCSKAGLQHWTPVDQQGQQVSVSSSNWLSLVNMAGGGSQ